MMIFVTILIKSLLWKYNTDFEIMLFDLVLFCTFLSQLSQLLLQVGGKKQKQKYAQPNFWIQFCIFNSIYFKYLKHI